MTSLRPLVALVLIALSACATTEGRKDAAALAAAAKAIDALADVSSERVAIADRVAASKWGTDKPIDDPAREKWVLDDIAKRASEMGIDADTVQRIFRDQIEANKVVQRGLHQRWEAAPEARPTSRPDLDKEVHPALDRIGGELLTAIRDAQPLLVSPHCKAAVERARHRASAELDELHKEGLQHALLHACP